MPDAPQTAPPRLMPPGLKPRPQATARTISALMLREMSTTYGRSSLGYVWAILEPAAGVLLLTFIFSLALRAPSIGTNFPLFYASGLLPFVAYIDTSQKISVAIRFSKPLLFYRGVTFLDALVARFLVNALTQLMIMAAVFGFIIIVYRVDVLFDPAAAANACGMAFALAVGIGTLNCHLISIFPAWERAWAVLNRPLFLISCVIFTFETVPQPYRDYLWWNPLVHVVGAMRTAIYATYDAPYVTPLYVYSISGICMVTGLLLLRRYHRDIANL